MDLYKEKTIKDQAVDEQFTDARHHQGLQTSWRLVFCSLPLDAGSLLTFIPLLDILLSSMNSVFKVAMGSLFHISTLLFC